MFVSLLLRQLEQIVDPPPQKVYWFYGEWQKAYSEMNLPHVKFQEGLSGEDFLNPNFRNLVVIDELFSKMDSKVTKLFTKGSHHRNTSIMQNLFHENKENCTITLNAH